MKRFTMGELFAGYGGLGHLGVGSVLPVDVRWVSDIDPGACRILAHRAPDAPNLGDITQVDWTTVEPVDVLTGGFPCQDVSHAGRRAGLIRDGEGRTRSGLWGHMLRAIDTLRPPLVVAENVRGLLSATADSDVEPCPFCMGDDREPPMRALGAVLADLADVGYDAWWIGLRAADVGAAHGRFRVFIFATPADSQRGRLPGWSPQQVGRPVIGAPVARGGEDAGRALTLLPTPAVNDMGEGKTVEHWDEWTAKMQAAHGNGNGHGKSLAIEEQRLLPTPRATDGTKRGPNQRGSSGDLMLPSAVNLLPTPNSSLVGPHGERGPRTLESRQGKQVELPDVIAHGQWGDYAPAIARWEALTRPAPDPTEPGPKGGPRLSAAFVEWLMGLPAGWITDPAIWEGDAEVEGKRRAGFTPSAARNAQLKAAGNGVVPAQAAAATRWFLDQIRLEDTA